MLQKLLLSALMILSGPSAPAHGNDIRITFQVTVPGVLPPLSHVYISSSRNGWSPGSPVWKMVQTSERSFRLDIDVPDGEKLEYHYTLGDPECIETTGEETVQQTRVFVAHSGVVRSDTVTRWTMESVNAGHWLSTDVYHFQYEWLKERWGESAIESMDAGNPVRNLRSVAQLDSVVQSARSEWRAISETRYGGVAPDLLSAFYQGLLSVPQQRALYPLLQDYLVEYYMAPALIREYPELRTSPSKAKVRLLLTPLITLQFALRMKPLSVPDTVLTNELPGLSALAAHRRDQWKKLSAIAEDWSSLIEQYLMDTTLAGEGEQSSLLALKLILAYLKPCWRIQEDLNNQRVADAVKALKVMAADREESVPASEIMMTATAVFRECVKRKMTGEALDIADICAEKGTSPSRPVPVGLSQLKPMYLEADPIRGEQRYNKACARYGKALPASPSMNSALQPPLSGRFLDMTSGDTVDLATLRGKIVVLDFWTTWCGSCVSQIPFLRSYANSVRSNPNIAFISVLCDPTTWNRGKSFVTTFVAAQRINYAVLVDRPDDSLNRRFHISWYPSRLVIGRDGRISLTPQASAHWDKVEECVDALLSR